mmetsp:Transcript_8293/g.18532  ORF Transcript_8293/g.18532 Transcript_8293/m.18532 type:complete len:184 (+) Transcript_8293:95-646(+)
MASSEYCLKDYAPPALVTVAFALHYSLFDVFSIGPLRKKYNVPYPRTDGPEEMQRAMRTQQNQLEQMPVFFALLWVAAAFVSPHFAGIVGCIWVALRIAYSFVYRSGTTRRELLMICTLPAYVCLWVLAFATIYQIAMFYVTRAQAAGVVAGLVVLYGTGAIANRRFLGRSSSSGHDALAPSE